MFRLSIQFFDSPLLCSPVWLTGCHATPLVTRCFQPQLFNVIPHPSMSYRQVYRPILYFQPSSLESDSQLCPTHPSHVTYRTSCCTRGHLHLPKKADNFRRGEKYFRHIDAYKYQFIHVKLVNILLVVKSITFF